MISDRPILLAQAVNAAPGAWQSPVLWATLALVVALLAGALLIALVGRWRKRSKEERPATGDQLSHFRSLYERGELSPEEFDRIRARLGAKLKRELNLPGKSDAATPKPPDPPAPGGAEE